MSSTACVDGPRALAPAAPPGSGRWSDQCLLAGRGCAQPSPWQLPASESLSAAASWYRRRSASRSAACCPAAVAGGGASGLRAWVRAGGGQPVPAACFTGRAAAAAAALVLAPHHHHHQRQQQGAAAVSHAAACAPSSGGSPAERRPGQPRQLRAQECGLTGDCRHRWPSPVHAPAPHHMWRTTRTLPMPVHLPMPAHPGASATWPTHRLHAPSHAGVQCGQAAPTPMQHHAAPCSTMPPCRLQDQPAAPQRA